MVREERNKTGNRLNIEGYYNNSNTIKMIGGKGMREGGKERREK